MVDMGQMQVRQWAGGACISSLATCFLQVIFECSPSSFFFGVWYPIPNPKNILPRPKIPVACHFRGSPISTFRVETPHSVIFIREEFRIPVKPARTSLRNRRTNGGCTALTAAHEHKPQASIVLHGRHSTIAVPETSATRLPHLPQASVVPREPLNTYSTWPATSDRISHLGGLKVEFVPISDVERRFQPSPPQVLDLTFCSRATRTGSIEHPRTTRCPSV